MHERAVEDQGAVATQPTAVALLAGFGHAVAAIVTPESRAGARLSARGRRARGRRHGHPAFGASLRRFRLPVFVAVLGPGLLAGLSDDDPAGITTYSIVGARYGYELLWVLALSVTALVVFHELGARLGLVTGKGP